ncbi:hypothetical protein D3C80_1987170 [compost metagenome]
MYRNIPDVKQHNSHFNLSPHYVKTSAIILHTVVLFHKKICYELPPTINSSRKQQVTRNGRCSFKGTRTSSSGLITCSIR